MNALYVGYTRSSTDQQDLTAATRCPDPSRVEPGRIYVGHGLTGTIRGRPGLREALAACRDGDSLVVTKRDRLARSLPDVRDIVHELTAAKVTFNIGDSVHDPTDPTRRVLFKVLAMIAELESDLIMTRTRGGTHTTTDLAELFSVARSTVHRAIERAGEGSHHKPRGQRQLVRGRR